MALKLRARTSGSLALDQSAKRQLVAAEQMRRAQADTVPPIDAPWCMFDLAEMRLYADDPVGFLNWVKKGLNTCTHRYEPETFHSAIQLLIDGGLRPRGIDEALPLVEAKMAALID